MSRLLGSPFDNTSQAALASASLHHSTLVSLMAQRPNAGIDPPEHNCDTAKFSMKAALFPVGSNPLLGFVRRSRSALPELSSLILSFNTTSAAWRFNLTKHQLLMSARGSQHSSSISIQAIRSFVIFQGGCFNSLS